MEKHDLGRKLSEHRWKSGPGLVFLWLVMGAPWVYLVFFKIPIHDFADGAIAFAMSAFVFGLLGWFTRLHFKKKNDRVDVYEQGLVHIVAGSEKALRWDEVEKVTSKVEQRGVSMLHVHYVEGKGLRWTFTQIFEDIEPLAHAIIDNVSRCVADRAMTRIRAGEQATVGRLLVSQDGLTKGDELLKWDEVQSIEADKNVVAIRKKGSLLAWATIDVGSANARAIERIAAMKPGEADRYR